MEKMLKRSRGRPRKRRFIEGNPRISQFSPRGRPGRPDEAVLSIDEYEAVRLAHYKGLSQEQAARSMNISQQTFSRTIKRAQKAIADALVNGKTIYIQGSGSHGAVEDQPAFAKLLNDTKEYLSGS
ncbi:MAG: DUF134 domain-containing protein [Candidatus Omnitrophota bacterium]